MMKSEFLERVNLIRQKKGYPLLSDISLSDYSIVEYVYTWHPIFDMPDAKDAIAEIYTIQSSVCNGMFLIKNMVDTAKKAQAIETRRSALRRKISNLEKELHALNDEMKKLAE